MLTNDDAVAPLAFPDGFVWGAATSAYQIEGGTDALGPHSVGVGRVLRDAPAQSPTATPARSPATTCTG